MELQSIYLCTDSALITGCEQRGLLPAMQLHKSMGKSHVPDTRDLSRGGVQTHLSCANTLENSRDGKRLERTARHPPGYSLAETLVHLQFISGIPLGFAEVMVLERQLHSLLLIRWFTVIPLGHILGPHLTCLAYKKSHAEGSKSRRSRA